MAGIWLGCGQNLNVKVTFYWKKEKLPQGSGTDMILNEILTILLQPPGYQFHDQAKHVKLWLNEHANPEKNK